MRSCEYPSFPQIHLSSNADLLHPHLLRHTVAQQLADEGTGEELLQQFFGHEAPETTQRHYEPKRTRVKEAFEEAMNG
jgi:integrase/recombinase XerD